ncbi:MAG: hypothetical protein HRT46_11635 [Deltaproteobacteria bacterium]|nr:hypothetical protein [Deltaproteobacteria bacterium]
MKITYKDFDGQECEIEAEVSIELDTGHINSTRDWQEKKLILRANGNVVGRKSLCYREVER